MDDIKRLVTPKPKHTTRNTILALVLMLLLSAIAAVAWEFRKVPVFKSTDELPG